VGGATLYQLYPLSWQGGANRAEKAYSSDEIISHQQETWVRALEWCESRGIPTAVNPKDLDGSQSWGAFQFKVETFKTLSEKYQIKGDLFDYRTQLAIVGKMILDKSIDLKHQFPGCVKKLGLPPK